MIVASFLAGALLTLLIPVGTLVLVWLYWWYFARGRDEI
jgi:hypothetical protein